MKKPLLFGLACLALVLAFFAASSLYKGRRAEKYGFLAEQSASLFVREHSPTYGSDEARVHLIEFMDPACETCAAFSPFVKQLMDAHPGRIRLVLRYAPFHDGADYFVKILEAARKQGKYWETLETMYLSQPYWASHQNPQPQLVWRFLSRAELDLERVRRDMEDPAIARIIGQDLADAAALGVRKTPGFFVNGKPLQSFGYEQLEQLVQAEISASYP
jgi:protein-disulfide isomerase